MMKNWGQQLIFAGYLIVMLLSSCSREDNVMDDVNGRSLVISATMQRFTENAPSLPQKRTAEDGAGETIWSAGDQVAVKSGGVTKTYLVDTAGKLTSSDPIYWTSLSETKIVDAWYPVSKPDIVDQSTNAKYEMCNVLKADQRSILFDGDHTMLFRHQMAHLKINFIDNWGGWDVAADKLEVYGVIQYDFLEGKITIPWNANQDNILANKTAAGFRILLLPQTVPVNEYFMRITYGTQIFLYSLSSSLVLEAGKNYNFTITLPIY